MSNVAVLVDSFSDAIHSQVREEFNPRPTLMFLDRKFGTVAALWGAAGAIAILVYAAARMVRHISEAISQPWSPWHYVVMILWAVFMAYSEGYRGFQRGYSPRVAARAVYLRQRSTRRRLLLAPLFCMGLFHAPRNRRITVVVLLMLIASIVVLFQYIPQPWRGILDVGVVIGLGWGIVATLVFFAKYWVSAEVPFDAEVVEASDP